MGDGPVDEEECDRTRRRILRWVSRAPLSEICVGRWGDLANARRWVQGRISGLDAVGGFAARGDCPLDPELKGSAFRRAAGR
jgi:hypothetical protein